MTKRLIHLIALCLLFSCIDNNQKTTYKSASSGNINSLLVVIDNALWTGRVGDALRENLGGEIYGLPQIEPQFDLRQVCLLYTSPSPRDAHESRMPSSA